MVWSHDHSPRFSYGRDFRPQGVFSYAPAFWGRPQAGGVARAEKARSEGEDAGRREMFMMVGGALGVVAVGALVWMAAKKQ